MQSETKLGAVGQRGAVLAFKALGMYVIPTTTEAETTAALNKMYKQGIRVVFITENEAEAAPEVIQKYRNDYRLAIIPIPGSKGATGYGMKAIRENVEKALGADILFND